jgi:glycosyltransferase involved in cell wall biosynthesis
MKILQVHWRYDAFGGGETYLEQLVRLLESSGHTVSVMSGLARSDPARIAAGSKHTLITESGGIRSALREIKGVMEQIEDIAPDVVHLHHTGGLLSPYIVQAINQRYPTVKTVHDVSVVCPQGDEMIKQCSGGLCEYPFDLGCIWRGCYSIPKKGVRPWVFALWERQVARQLCRLVVSTEYIRKELLRNDFLAERITVLPLFTSLNQDNSVAPTAAAQKRLLFVGRLDNSKGGTELIDALALIRPHENWQADVIGEGPVLATLKRRVVDTGLVERVLFHGRVDPGEMPDYYRRARVVIMPSMIPESFGLVGIEAMSCGRPVVAFDSGGIRDWLAHGETGFLVERGNVRQLADRIEQLLTDDDLAGAMGENAMRRVKELFQPETHLRKLLAVYKDVCSPGRDVKMSSAL